MNRQKSHVAESGGEYRSYSASTIPMMSGCGSSFTSLNKMKNTSVMESTPLLTNLVSAYIPSITEVSVNQKIVGDNESKEIPLVDEAVPILKKRTSSLPLSVEIETILAFRGEVDGYRDLKLKKDDETKLKEGEYNANQGGEICFHGGISQRKFWVIFAGILISNFVAAADSTIMASTHTSITSAFNSSNAASWLSTSFMLTSTAFQPLYGRVSDTIGRKIPFVFSCFVFTIATAWCALAGSMGSFIAARAVCGIGAGGMLTMGSIVLSDVLPIEIRGSYQSINNLAYGAGSALGAAVGGLLADSIGWRWEFGIQVPFGLFCMIVCMLTIPNPESQDNGPQEDMWARLRDFDIAGSIYLTTSVACLILGMSLGGNIFPWAHPLVLICLILSVILGNLLLHAERSAKIPVMPLELIWGSPRGSLIFNNFFEAATINTIFFNLPLYFQTVLLDSATIAGSRLLVPSLAGTTTSVAAGIIITHTGRLKPVLFAGSIIVVLGTISLCCMDRSFPGWLFLIFLIPTNLGVGFVFPATLMSVLATSSQNDQAVATSTLILWRCLGSVIGVASSSLIVQNCLYYFLEKRVTGASKREVIEKVRKSVTAIFDLPKQTQQQVISSYDSSLRVCFAWSVFTAIVGLVLIAGIQLPVLGSRPSVQDVKSSATTGGERNHNYQKLDDEC